LKTLNCHTNQLTSLPALPSALVELRCFRNNISSLPALPNTLEILDCPFNPFAAGLPELPAALKELNCISCQLTSLPTLPDALTLLLCRDNQIKSLPILPNHLTELDFSDNQISFITDLPDTLVKLKFTNNKINSLPPIPATVSLINCENNYFSFSGGAVSALAQFTGTKTCTPQYRIIYSGEDVSLEIGESVQLANNAIQRQKSSDGSNWENTGSVNFSELTFTGSGSNPANINAAGLITAVDEGSCTVYANLTLNIYVGIDVNVSASDQAGVPNGGSSSDTATAPTYDGSQTGWAEPELTQAYAWGLTYPDVMSNFQNSITREEFCVISVKLYEKLTGNAAVPGSNPFTDTSNQDVLKAYELGIVRGVSADRFAPNNSITRQEMCVMIFRALQAAGESTIIQPGISFTFIDADSIASWALNEVRFCNQRNIMKGTSQSTISPLRNTPREQAIVMIKRAYEAFK
jgi:hypothetical protein